MRLTPDTIRLAIDCGDHFLIEHAEHGMQPVIKAGLSPKEHAAIEKMCHGGTVERMADGGEVADQPDAGEAPVDGDPSPKVLMVSPNGTQSPVPERVADEYRKIGFRDVVPDAGTPDSPGDQGQPRIAVDPGTGLQVYKSDPQPAPGATTTIAPDGTVTIQHAPQGPPDLQALGKKFASGFQAQQPFQGQLSAPVEPAAPEAPYQSELVGPDGQPVIGPPKTPAQPATTTAPATTAPTQPVQPAPPTSTLPGVPNVGGQVGQLGQSTAESLTRQGQAQSALDAEIASHLAEKQKIIDQFQGEVRNRLEQYDQQASRLRELIQKDIDPTNIFKRNADWQNVVGLIGLGLGTFGAQWAGKPNTALELFNRAIDRDIQAQERNQAKNIDLARLSMEQQRQYIEQKGLLKTNALESIGAIMDAAAAKAGSQIDKERYLQLGNATKSDALVKKQQLATESAKFGIERQLADFQLRALKLQQRQQALSYNLTADALGLPHMDPETGRVSTQAPTGPAPAVREAGIPPQIVPQLVDKAIRRPDEFGVLVKEPQRQLVPDAVTGKLEPIGPPLVDPQTGRVVTRETIRILQDEKTRPDVIGRAAFLSQIQEPVAELQALVAGHPEGTVFDRAAVEKAADLKQRISMGLTEAQTGSSRLNEADIKLAGQLAADLGVLDAGLGKSEIRTEQLQHTVDAATRALDNYFYPDAWVQALYRGRR